MYLLSQQHLEFIDSNKGNLCMLFVACIIKVIYICVCTIVYYNVPVLYQYMNCDFSIVANGMDNLLICLFDINRVYDINGN